MMQTNLMILMYALIFISLLCVVWYVIFSFYIKKQTTKKKMPFLKTLKPAIWLNKISLICSILLINSDEEISKALNYIEPSKHTDKLLEKLYEQSRIEAKYYRNSKEVTIWQTTLK